MTEPEGERVSGGGTLALVTGCAGIVVLGLLLTLVTAVLAASAGAAARARGASLENAYLGLVLAALDGVVWIALHLMFDIPFWLG